MPHSSSQRPFLSQVQVELKKGETIMIDAFLHLSAAFLHESFSDRSGFPPDHFELYYRGKRLEGEAALASWGVGKGATIEVKMRGRGGGNETDKDGQQPEASSSGASSSSAISPAELDAMAKLGENMDASEKETAAMKGEAAEVSLADVAKMVQMEDANTASRVQEAPGGGRAAPARTAAAAAAQSSPGDVGSPAFAADDSSVDALAVHNARIRKDTRSCTTTCAGALRPPAHPTVHSHAQGMRVASTVGTWRRPHAVA